jgi:dienelactone hydrolase
LNGVLATDADRAGKRPGLLVVHGGAGLDDHARGRARSGAPISGVVSVHGNLETTRPAEPSSIRARILVCHGALDPHVPMSQVTTFAEEMKHAGAD